MRFFERCARVKVNVWCSTKTSLSRLFCRRASSVTWAMRKWGLIGRHILRVLPGFLCSFGRASYEGEPADVVDIVTEYGKWLASSDLPKLFISAEPGAVLVGRSRELCRTWPNQQETSVRGIHFIQEDSPAEIGSAVQAFIKAIQI